jgi:hypothetical protein
MGSRIAGELEEPCEQNECWKILESNFKTSAQGEELNRTCDEVMEGEPKTIAGLKA